MAVLTITECDALLEVSLGRMQIAKMPAVAEQQVVIAGGSNPSAAFNPRTKFVRLHAGAACSVAWGDSPVAVSGNCPLEGGQTEYFGVNPGQKLAVIQT